VVNKSKTDIVIQILETVNNYEDVNDYEDGGEKGITLETIMNHVSLGNTPIEQYLKSLVENDLLNYDSYTQTFKITEKGLILLQGYKKIDQELKEKQI
jgi:predicted transcriptional regulator